MNAAAEALSLFGTTRRAGSISRALRAPVELYLDLRVAAVPQEHTTPQKSCRFLILNGYIHSVNLGQSR